MTLWQFTPSLLLVIIAALFPAGLAVYTWRRRHVRGAWALVTVLSLAALWSASYALELASTTIDAKLLWIRLQYVGITMLPVAWLAFALFYTTTLSTRRLLQYSVGLAFFPALSLLMVWTSGAHTLFYQDLVLIDTGSFVNLEPVYGRWFWFHTLYAYACYLAGTVLLVRHYQAQEGAARRAAAILVVGSLPPFLANFLYLVTSPAIDPSPIAFAVSGALYTWGFFRLRVLDMLPELGPLPQATTTADLGTALQASRERILNVALLGLTVLGLVQMLVVFADELSQPPVDVSTIVTSLVVYGAVLAVALVRRVPYGMRAGVFLATLYLFSLSNMRTYGLDVDTGFTLFAFLVFTYLLFGGRATAVSLVLGMLTVGYGAWSILTGRWEVASFYAAGSALTNALAPVISLTLFVAVVVAALASLQHDMRMLLERSLGLSRELNEERRLLERRVAERTRALETSMEVSRRLSTILNPDQLVHEIVEQLREAYDYYHAHIYLWDQAQRELVMVGGTGEVGWKLLERGHRIPAGRGLVGRAATTGDLVLATDVHRVPDWLPNDLLPDTRSELAVPIRYRDEVLGVLDVQDNRREGLTFEDAQLVQSVANQVAVALRNARLYAETQQRAEELALINRVVSAVAVSLDLRQNMQIIVDELAHVLGVDLVGIALLNEARTGLMVVVEHPAPDVAPSAVGLQIPLKGNAATQQVIDTRRRLIVEDPQTSPLTATVHELMRERDVQSLVIMPIVIGSEVVGTLGIDLLPDDVPLTESQLNLAETLVYQAATAVQSTRLFERTQAALAETESLYQSSAELNRAQSFEDILNVIRAHTHLGQSADLLYMTQFDRPWADDAPPEGLYLLGAWSRGPALQRPVFLPLDELPYAALLDPDAPVGVSDVDAHAALTETFGGIGLRSALFMPLRVGQRWVGYLGVGYAAAQEFEAHDVRRLASLVAQASVAAQTLVLLDETQRALAEQARLSSQLRTVAEVGTAVTTILALDNLLQTVVDLTKARFGLYHAHVYLLDETGRLLRLRAGAGNVGRQMVAEGRSIPIDAASLVARAARRREPVVVNDVGQSEDFLPHPLLPKTRAEMAVPLLVGNQLVGVLDVQADENGRFTPEDVVIQQTLASQVAVAVQNAYLYAEQVETADSLRQVDRLKSEFLASMSHELRTPLNSIIGFADVLLTGIDGELNERMQEDVEIIRSSGSHLRELIGDILDMSKIEAGRMELQIEPVNVRQLVNDVATSAGVSAAKKSLEMRLELDESVADVPADRVRLRQVLWNIVDNAIKYTDSGCVTIRMHGRSDDVLFAVEDTGIGIRQDDIPIVFEQFRQVDTSKSGTKGGSGLGMPISKRLVELHGGDIWLESREGEGTTFWFTIPRSGPNGQRAVESDRSAARGDKQQ